MDDGQVFHCRKRIRFMGMILCVISPVVIFDENVNIDNSFGENTNIILTLFVCVWIFTCLLYCYYICKKSYIKLDEKELIINKPNCCKLFNNEELIIPYEQIKLVRIDYKRWNKVTIIKEDSKQKKNITFFCLSDGDGFTKALEQKGIKVENRYAIEIFGIKL